MKFVDFVMVLRMSRAFIAAPIAVWLGLAEMQTDFDNRWLFINQFDGVVYRSCGHGVLRLLFVLGVLLLIGMLHIARGIGYLYSRLAKHLLVKIAQ
jgi:hypothetical protein